MQCVDLHQMLDLKPNQTKINENKTKKTEKTIKDIYGTIGGNSNVDWVLDDIIYVNQSQIILKYLKVKYSVCNFKYFNKKKVLKRRKNKCSKTKKQLVNLGRGLNVY